MTVGKRFGDISTLPEAIRNQIVESQKMVAFDDIVLAALESFEIEASVSEIFVEVYRATGNEDLKKQAISRSLYRLKKDGLIESTRTGIYSVIERDTSEDVTDEVQEA